MSKFTQIKTKSWIFVLKIIDTWEFEDITAVQFFEPHCMPVLQIADIILAAKKVKVTTLKTWQSCHITNNV